MAKSMASFGTQVQALLKTMTAGKMISLSILVVATIWGLVALINWSGRPDYVPLYTQLSAEDAGEVVGRLRDRKIPYQLSHDGSTIQIPREMIYEIRLDFAAQGLPKGSGIGFEVFDNTKLGVTEFVQNINYQRALQGELSRTINCLAEVQSSRVHIVIPPRSVFIEHEEPATASVILNLHHGRWLNQDQVQGIVHLVSSSVPRLTPENITVVDQDGKMLAGAQDEGSVSKLSADHLEFQRKKERLVEQSVVSMLEQVVGRDKAIVRVSCDLDFVQQESTEELYLPDNQVVRSEQSSSEASSKTDAGPMGVPGMASNISKDNPSESQNSTPGTYKKQDSTRNYEIGKKTNRKILPVGVLKRLSVAVIVDGKYETIVKGKGDKQHKETKYVARSEEELATLENIVKRAVNFDESRGDKVEVANMPFSTDKLADMSDPGSVNRWLDGIRSYGSYIKYIVGGLFVLFTFIYVIRPLIRWLTDTSWEDVELLEHLPKTIAEIERQYLNKEQQQSPVISQAAQIMERNKSDSTQLVQQWLKET